jgi:hypothetical protein
LKAGAISVLPKYQIFYINTVLQRREVNILNIIMGFSPTLQQPHDKCIGFYPKSTVLEIYNPYGIMVVGVIHFSINILSLTGHTKFLLYHHQDSS